MTWRRVGGADSVAALLAACSGGLLAGDVDHVDHVERVGWRGGWSCAGTVRGDPGASVAVPWSVDGSPRSALVHRPADAVSAGSPPPVVIALHGYGSFGLDMETTSGLSTAADEHGWLVVYPEGTGTPEAWGSIAQRIRDTPRMLRSLRQVIQDVVAGGCGDAKRVIVTGISQGGWLSDMVGCEMTDVVSAVVPVAGRDMGWSCSPAKPIPFVAVNGVLDDVLPFKGGPVDVVAPVTTVDLLGGRVVADRAASRGCAGKPTGTTVSPHVQREAWSGCAAPVTLYRVEDGGHSWPSGGGLPPVDRELSVTKVIADLLGEG